MEGVWKFVSIGLVVDELGTEIKTMLCDRKIREAWKVLKKRDLREKMIF